MSGGWRRHGRPVARASPSAATVAAASSGGRNSSARRLMRKSTLLKSVMNAGPRIRGRISFDGVDLADAPPHRRARLGLALVPEDRRIFTHLTVAENIAMARYGSDKPDLRYGLELADFGDAFRGAPFEITARALDQGGRVRGLRVPAAFAASLSRKQLDEIAAAAKTLGAREVLTVKNAGGAVCTNCRP